MSTQLFLHGVTEVGLSWVLLEGGTEVTYLEIGQDGQFKPPSPVKIVLFSSDTLTKTPCRIPFVDKRVGEKAAGEFIPSQEEGNIEEEDICGLCGKPGADKIPHPIHWPGEQIPDSRLVHTDCENKECKRAHAEFTNEQRKSFLRSIK